MKYLFLLISPYKVFCIFCSQILKFGTRGRTILNKSKLGLGADVFIGDVRFIGRNIRIGKNTYFNSGHMATDSEAGISIGRWCAIGHNVTILAVTHDTGIPTGDEKVRPVKKGNVIIEDGVWIGSNVIITPGVTIGRQAVIGGNAVVVKDIPAYSVCSGIPCKPLYLKSEQEIESHNKLMI